jgi:AcrR family transcriptional regulator
MARTRAGLLDGARRAVARQGTRRTTMHDIASQAGVAKATLYNHFRTKDDVWSALVAAEVDQLAQECAGLPLAGALSHAATRLSAHPGLRRVASTEPAVLARLLLTDPPAAGWQAARDATRRQLAAANRCGDDLVLRWLTSFLVCPGQPDAIRLAAECLAAALPTGAAPARPRPDPDHAGQ